MRYGSVWFGWPVSVLLYPHLLVIVVICFFKHASVKFSCQHSWSAACVPQPTHKTGAMPMWLCSNFYGEYLSVLIFLLWIFYVLSIGSPHLHYHLVNYSTFLQFVIKYWKSCFEIILQCTEWTQPLRHVRKLSPLRGHGGVCILGPDCKGVGYIWWVFQMQLWVRIPI